MNEHGERQRKHWDSVADGWATWAEWTERNFSPLADWFARATGWRSGARVLDVASGAGFPALAAAARVGATGAVFATDISRDMVAVVGRRARAGRIANVEALEMDAEHLGFDGESFDAVTNAYGLMFFGEPRRALEEARRVLKRGGRCGVAVWAEPADSPFFTVMFGAAGPLFGMPPPAAGAPGPFRFASRADLAGEMRAAGFTDVSVDRVEMTFECENAESYLRMFRDVAWKGRLAGLSRSELARFQDAVATAVSPYTIGGRLLLSTVSLCAAGSR
jgi:ubiquinone/menaquinone biosynthesis C-methylase UbiE